MVGGETDAASSIFKISKMDGSGKADDTVTEVKKLWHGERREAKGRVRFHLSGAVAANNYCLKKQRLEMSHDSKEVRIAGLHYITLQYHRVLGGCTWLDSVPRNSEIL